MRKKTKKKKKNDLTPKYLEELNLRLKELDNRFKEIKDDKLERINNSLISLKNKDPYFIYLITAIALIGTLVLSIFNTYLIFKENQPLVIPRPLLCGDNIDMGTWVDPVFTNMGGSETILEAKIETKGFNCFHNEYDYNGIDMDDVKLWNKKYNDTVCSKTFMIDSGGIFPIRFIVFRDLDFKGYDSYYDVKFRYLRNNRFTKYYPIKRCEFNRNKDDRYWKSKLKGE